MPHDFTTDDNIRALADMERQMDRGIAPFVMYRGRRWAVPSETMAQLGLETGQTASDFLITQILETNIANWTAEIELEKSQ